MGNGTDAESESFVLHFWKYPEFEGHTQHIYILYFILKFYFILIFYFIWVCFHLLQHPQGSSSPGRNPLPPSADTNGEGKPCQTHKGQECQHQEQEGAPPFYKQASCTTSTSQSDRAAHYMS